MKIEIIGQGNVAWHLAKAFEKDLDVNRVSSRTLEGLRRDADIALICVSDSAIREVAEKVARRISKTTVLAHTSGTTSLQEIADLHERTCVIYPLQTFTAGVELDYREIPFFLEASDEQTKNLCWKMVCSVGAPVNFIDSEKRAELHLASIFACNFANRLWAISDEYLSEKGLDFKLLAPLLKETLRKAMEMKPAQAQTGPAKRGDLKTIREHNRRLADKPEMLEIYNLLTRSIMES